MSLRLSTASVVALLAIACGPGEDGTESDGTWVGTITTEGNVTTVINESGSVWGGTATLVEEASIGVESGPEEYMLADISFLYADDERTYLVQPGIPAVRLYDHAGAYVGDLGRPGQGPGEHAVPVMAAGSADGHSFVYDNALNRTNVYDARGEPVDTWSFQNAACCAWPLAVSPGGKLRALIQEWHEKDNANELRYGVQTFGVAGPEGSVLWEPSMAYEKLTIKVGDREWEMVPFSAEPRRAAMSQGIVTGVSNEYRFEVHGFDGNVIVVSRFWHPVPVDPAEAEWHKRWREAASQERNPGWTWTGDEPPSHKPAYSELIPAASGEVWVVRAGPSRRLANCVEDPMDDFRRASQSPCWRAEVILDVFGPDGRYRGDVEIPEGMRPSLRSLFARGDAVFAVTEDDAGTIMVKRYRLVLPGEQ